MTHYVVKPITVAVRKPKSVDVVVDSQQQLVFEFNNASIISGEGYPGPYTVTPSDTQQVLNTADKLMYSNVTIYAIPYTEQNNVAYIAPKTTQTTTQTLSKVIYSDKVLMDLTSDTVSAPYLKEGLTAHLANGQSVTGTASWSYDATNQELSVPSWALEVE